jgi:acyl dehydratase
MGGGGGRSTIEPNYFYEDVIVGVTAVSGEILVDHDEMLAYNKAYDPWPFHVDEVAAAVSPFGGIIASGGYTISLLYRLAHNLDRELDRVQAFLGGFDWQVKFAQPVRAGDRLRLRATVTEKRLSSKPGRGVTNWLSEVVNQDDQTVLSVAGASLIATRPRP